MMIAAEVSRRECSKLGELEVERNPNPVHQIINSKVLLSSAVLEFSPSISDP